jgi:hypothetical protein
VPKNLRKRRKRARKFGGTVTLWSEKRRRYANERGRRIMGRGTGVEVVADVSLLVPRPINLGRLIADYTRL